MIFDNATDQRPTVVLPDTTPPILLAAAQALHVLTDFGRVDIVAMEATHDRSKPFANEIAAWIEAGQIVGSNAQIEIARTELGPLYSVAIEQRLKKPRHLGELAMAEWLVDRLADVGAPALVVYEDGKVPSILARQGLAEEVAVATTRNVLSMAEENGYIADAEAMWAGIKKRGFRPPTRLRSSR